MQLTVHRIIVIAVTHDEELIPTSNSQHLKACFATKRMQNLK